MPIAAVVADANVLLSAVIGKAALRVFTEFGVAVHVTEFNVEEVAEYLPHLADKYGLAAELVALQWKLLPVVLHPESDYASRLARARRDLAARDPDDAHPLALARALRLPLWSNDRDLSGLVAESYSTAQLLRSLETGRERGSSPA
jgi:predicted nucleic acid-binding protein